MPVSLINTKMLTLLPGTGTGNFSHKVKKCAVPGMAQTFFLKEMESYTVALIELLAQEFFRLIVPWQPQTLMAYDSSLKTYFILSMEVEGYKPLPTGVQEQFNQGMYHGLGLILINSIFLQEIDLKNGNICLNQNGFVVKIDGDWCFASIRDLGFKRYEKDITPELLNNLPFPVGYTAFNWLDIYQKEVAYFNSSIVNEKLSSAPFFRNEINEALLKILLLPEDYIKRFVDAYVPISVKADVFIDYLKKRYEELKCAAFQNVLFKQYLLEESTKSVVQQHILHLGSFVANRIFPLVSDSDKVLLHGTVMELYDDLINSVFSKTFEELDNINIDYSFLNSTEELFSYRDKLLEKVYGCLTGLCKPQNEKLATKYSILYEQVEKKIKAIDDGTKKLEQHFLLLDQIYFAKHREIFGHKLIQMQQKALRNSNYKKAAQTAKIFCDDLNEIKKNFLTAGSSYDQAKKEFKNQCLEVVIEAKEELKNHRDWLGALRKFLIEIISFFTRGLCSNFSLFTKTDSFKKIEHIEQNILSILV